MNLTEVLAIGIPTISLTISSILILYTNFKIAIITSLVTCIISVISLSISWGLGLTDVLLFDNIIIIDKLGYFLSITSIISSIIVVVGSYDHIRLWRTANSLISLILLTLLGIIFLSFSNNIVLIIISWAISSAATYAISVLRKDLLSGDAGLKYLIMGLISSSFMILGFSLYILASSSLQLLSVAGISYINILPISIVFLGVAFLFKMGAFPFQGWLPDVYILADRVAVSFISSIGKFIGIVPLIRIIYNLLNSSTYSVFNTVVLILFSVIAILSLIYGNVIAFSRRELSAMLSYSSIAQVGFILLGVSVLPSNIAVAGILLHLLAYSIAQAGLFLLTSYVEKVAGTSRFEGLRGFSKDRLITASSILLLLSLLGVPPLLGFWSKLFIFASTISYPWLTIIGVLMSAISAGYYILPIREIFREGEVEIVRSSERTAVIVAGFLILVLGLIAPLIYGVLS
ncbi:MAG: NADH-quinone oxidoreductase subunit NuoN [Sulfolobaceae archaeon]